VESTVKYIKRNALADYEFESLELLQAHLDKWMREISDTRIHGTTHERPIDRFQQEVSDLSPLNNKPPFQQIRELQRIVQSDASIEVAGNFYSVPWEWIKSTVTVQLNNEQLFVFQGGSEIARHPICQGERKCSIQPDHLQGVIIPQNQTEHNSKKYPPPKPSILLRPLSEYEAVTGGRW